MKIELYLNSTNAQIESGDPYYESASSKSMLSWHGPPSGYKISKQAFVEFSLEEKEVYALVVDIASKNNIKLKIYDMAKYRYAIRAYFKRVRVTPTVIIGKQRLTGNINEEQINRMLKERLGRNK